MVTFSTQVPDYHSQSTALLDLFFPFNVSIFCTMVFPPLGNCDHVIVSTFIDFSSNCQRDAPLHLRTYVYSRAVWNGLHDNLRKFPWDNIFKNSASAPSDEFFEWVQAAIGVYL